MKVNNLFKKTLVVRFKLINDRSIFTISGKKINIGDIVEIHSDGEFNWFKIDGQIFIKIKISVANYTVWFNVVKRKHVEILYEKSNT